MRKVTPSLSIRAIVWEDGQYGTSLKSDFRGEPLGRITMILVESRFPPSAALEGLTKCALVRPSLKCSDSLSEGLTVCSSLLAYGVF